jgi:hypothetical protein
METHDLVLIERKHGPFPCSNNHSATPGESVGELHSAIRADTSEIHYCCARSVQAFKNLDYS